MFYNVIEYAENTLNTLGLKHYGIRLNGRLTRALGRCKPRQHTIELSKKFVQAEGGLTEQVKQVVLHEIAHAIDWQEYGVGGHGATFKEICKRIGCTLDDSSVTIDHDLNPPNWQVVFNGCQVATYVRKPKRFNPETSYIVGQKAETLGKLRLVKINP